ncbi:MAG: ABC transporter permease, partial [Steroidobacteraceae bacterium]
AWRFPRLIPHGVSLETWRSVAPDLGASVATTLLLGLLTAVIAVVIVLISAEALHERPRTLRRIGTVLFIPLLLPQMAFLFGWQVLLVRFELDGTRFAVCWTHAVFALPYVWAVLADARATLNPGYLAAARVLGAGPIRAWLTVTVPLLLRSILLAVALAFAVSVALYLPTLFAGAGRVATLATEAAASVVSGNLRSAAISAAAQALVPLAMFGTVLSLSRVLFRHRRGVPR